MVSLGNNYKNASFYTKLGFLISTLCCSVPVKAIDDGMDMDISRFTPTNLQQNFPPHQLPQNWDQFNPLILCIQNNELGVWLGINNHIKSSNLNHKESVKYTLTQLFLKDRNLMFDKISNFARSNIPQENDIAYNVLFFLATTHTYKEFDNFSFNLLGSLILLYNYKEMEQIKIEMEWAKKPIIDLFQLGDNKQAQIYTNIQEITNIIDLSGWIRKWVHDKDSQVQQIAIDIMTPLVYEEAPWATELFKELEKLPSSSITDSPYNKIVEAMQDENFAAYSVDSDDRTSDSECENDDSDDSDDSISFESEEEEEMN